MAEEKSCTPAISQPAEALLYRHHLWPLKTTSSSYVYLPLVRASSLRSSLLRFSFPPSCRFSATFTLLHGLFHRPREVNPSPGEISLLFAARFCLYNSRNDVSRFSPIFHAWRSIEWYPADRGERTREIHVITWIVRRSGKIGTLFPYFSFTASSLPLETTWKIKRVTCRWLDFCYFLKRVSFGWVPVLLFRW